jgi:hypothetical protein
MRINPGKAKRTQAKAKKAGGFTSTSRLDPYKNFKFRP